jgi:hypothetical protein
MNISSGTAVPAWAYIDVVTEDIFDPVYATQAVGLPESTVGNDQTSPSESPSISPTSNMSRDTIIIIGGAVGGIVGFGLLAGVFILCYLKRRRALARKRESQVMETTAAPPASQDPNALPSTGDSSSNQSGPQSPPGGFYSHSSPWSPPL